MDKFAVGEVAIMQNSRDPINNDRECVILCPPKTYCLLNHGNLVVYAYVTQTSDGEKWASRPDQLRKRRPPDADELAAWTAALDCIDKAKRSAGIPA